MATTIGSSKTSAARTFSTRIDIPAESRTDLVALLNARLADTLDLYSQTKQAHWNVKGEEFIQLHELYDELAEAVEEYGDLMAERATALGGEALGTVRMSAAATTLDEFPRDAYDGLDATTALADRFATYGRQVRQDADRAMELGDAGTNDLLVEVSRGVDKHLWFLEAHLQRGR